MSCLYKIFSPDTSLKVSQKWYEIGIYLFKGSSLWESSAIQTILLETNSIDKRKRMITCKIAVFNLIFITLFWGNLNICRFLYYFAFFPHRYQKLSGLLQWFMKYWLCERGYFTKVTSKTANITYWLIVREQSNLRN